MNAKSAKLVRKQAREMNFPYKLLKKAFKRLSPESQRKLMVKLGSKQT